MGSRDNCAVDNLAVNSGSFTGAGAYPATLTVTDVHGNSSNCNATVTIEQRPTTLVSGGFSPVQYSDAVTLSATLTDATNNNSGIAGRTITFTIGSQEVSGVTNAGGVATATLNLTQAPGSYSVDLSFAGDAVYLAGADSDPFTITPEDARAYFTGPLLVSTAGSNSTDATVLLAATIKDMTEVDPGADPDAGDITYATVTFIDRDNGAAISPALPVALLAGGTATVTYDWDVSLNNNEDARDYTVGMRVEGYYAHNVAEENVAVNIYKPQNDFVVGSGHIILTDNSEGVMAGDAGTKNDFAFNIKFNNAGTNLQGRLRVLLRRTEADGLRHTYQIKGNNMQSLGVDGGTGYAVFTGKANIQDITDPDNTLSLSGNKTLQIEMFDNGGGPTDLIGFTLYDNGSQLWFSNDWDGIETAVQNLDRGNLRVNAGGSNGNGNLAVHYGDEDLAVPANTAPATRVERSADAVIAENVDFNLYPNPAMSEINVDLEAFLGETLSLVVYNKLGRRVRVIRIEEVQMPVHRVKVDQLAPGAYLMQVRMEGKVLSKSFLILRD